MVAETTTSDEAAVRRPACRFCGAALAATAVDLGMSPLCERFLRADQLDEMEPFFPLRVLVCERCWLVQLAEYVAPEEIFGEYAYFSSYSDSWVAHARRYAERMIEDLSLDGTSLVVELGSNDGYLLRHFVERSVPVLGIEPARNVSAAALERGVPTLNRFFGRSLADELRSDGRRADLIVGNNVLAQVPNVNDFVAGIERLLAPHGLVTIEVPHLLRLLDGLQFDTIYHEHFSYFSLAAAQRIFGAHGLDVVDVEELSTHGGSLRLHFRHRGSAIPTSRVEEILARERSAGLETLEPYRRFGRAVADLKAALLELLIGERRAGRRVAGYGAPGKANTLLNYCGIRTDLLAYTVDRNPYKHGRFTPGTHIPIRPVDELDADRPDDIWILPWNLTDEIRAQLEGRTSWGARFIAAIPSPRFVA
jgi:SAM-dependent methyltransferase